MVKGLGARVIEIEAPFDPEGGAYAGGGHAHAHEHGRTPITAHDHAIARSWPSRSRSRTITITTTSIAITTITTAIPMLMTTNRSPARRTHRARDDGRPRRAALYRLMTWLSPAFPVGAFSYSSGIEWAVEAGDITDAAIAAGLAGVDAVGRRRLLRRRVSGACASRAPPRMTMRALREVAELAAAFAPSRERHLETTSQGRAFIEIARAAWNCDGLDRADRGLRRRRSSIPSRSASSARRMPFRWPDAARVPACA